MRRQPLIERGGVLPAGYTQLQYIESTGTQYIDTGLSAPDGFGFVLDIMLKNNTANEYVVGAHNMSSPYERNGVGVTASGTKYQLGLGDSYPSIAASPFMNERLVLSGETTKGDSCLYLNGNGIIASTDSSARSSNNILVFTNQYDVNLRAPTLKGVAYGIELIVSGITYIFATAIRDSDGKPGLYNFTQNQFHTNQGSGEFLYA